MNLYLRLIILIIKTRFKPDLAFTEKSILKFYVLPNDLDFNMHMNNGRYNNIMDLGRIDLMLRSGAAELLRKKKWFGIVGSMQTKYRRPLKLLQAYELHTQAVFWNEKWIWIEQEIYSKNKLISSSLVQTLIRGEGENISPSRLQQEMNLSLQPIKITNRIKLLESYLQYDEPCIVKQQNE
ncbi:Uncharacterized protein Rru_A1307 [hydrothermal vent metagenome]|uniref:Uncharacterized protein Rru_A1307 n=1 Tax=hydrothermal vent metagenome TaxID=652676 RepID=A0A3B0X898_9ZZZZ